MCLRPLHFHFSHLIFDWKGANYPMKHLCTQTAIGAVLQISLLFSGCSRSAPQATQAQSEPETLSRTEFTGRVENYFEYAPLHAGKSSPFLIHLTDLSDGSPVEKAEVRLAVRGKDSADIAAQTVAHIGKVSGIYVAELNIPRPGGYDVEFHIKNDKLDERISSSDFKVE